VSEEKYYKKLLIYVKCITEHVDNNYLSKCIGLKYLECDRYVLRKTFSNLINLKELDSLHNKNIGCDEILRMRKLKHLRYERNEKFYDMSFRHLKNISRLDCGMGIDFDFEHVINKLVNLTCYETYDSIDASFISSLKNLIYLSCEILEEKNGDIIKTLRQLKYLRRFSCQDSSHKINDEIIGELTHLTHLNCVTCESEIVKGETLYKLTNLRSLKCNYGISDASLKYSVNLRRLHCISNVQITPNVFKPLKKLKYFQYCKYNKNFNIEELRKTKINEILRIETGSNKAEIIRPIKRKTQIILRKHPFNGQWWAYDGGGIFEKYS
jgi:hypothetical protein